MSSASGVEVAQEKFWTRIIYLTSALLCGAVAFLALGPRPQGTQGAIDVSMLPGVNAALNSLTALLLCVGWVLILKGKRRAHRNMMFAAFTSSTAFLVSYVLYHWFKDGPRPYLGAWSTTYYRH